MVLHINSNKLFSFTASLMMMLLALEAHATILPEKLIKHKANANGSYLFVQTAPKAIVQADKKDKKLFYITLKNVHPYVTYFSERPRRNAGFIPITNFIKIWQSDQARSFKKEAPNADLNGVEKGFFSAYKRFNVPLEIFNPIYDSKEKTLQYTARLLQGESNTIPSYIILHHVTLFIDDACLSCW